MTPFFSSWIRSRKKQVQNFQIKLILKKIESKIPRLVIVRRFHVRRTFRRSEFNPFASNFVFDGFIPGSKALWQKRKYKKSNERRKEDDRVQKT